jgi:hypothetical protein
MTGSALAKKGGVKKTKDSILNVRSIQSSGITSQSNNSGGNNVKKT